MHLDPRIYEKAAWQSKELALYIAVLQREGYVGVEKQKMYQTVKDFLWCHNIPFASNTRGMIWLSTCEGYLMELFSNEK